MRPLHTYMIFNFDGSCITSEVLAASHENALVVFAERCERNPTLAGLVSVGQAYVVFDRDANSNYAKVRVLRLGARRAPSFYAEAV